MHWSASHCRCAARRGIACDGALPHTPTDAPWATAAIGLHAQELYLDRRQACCDAPTKVTQILLNLKVA